MEATNQSTPVVLSDEQVAEIEARITKLPEGPWFAAFDPAKECGPHRDSGLALVDTGRESDWPVARLCEWHAARFIAASITDIPALCATVRALRDERAKTMALLSPDIPRTDLCDAARQIVFAHALERGNAEKLQEKNAALRDQLAEARTWIDRKNAAIETWQQQAKENAARLAEVERERNSLHGLRSQVVGLNTRLAQVERERDDARETLKLRSRKMTTVNTEERKRLKQIRERHEQWKKANPECVTEHGIEAVDFAYDAATRMREACVEKVRAMMETWSDPEHGREDEISGFMVDAGNEIITALESLTLDQAEKKQP